MKARILIRPMLAGALIFAGLGFYSLKKSAPEDLGFHRAQIDDRGLLELAVDEIRQNVTGASHLRELELTASGIQIDGNRAVMHGTISSKNKFENPVELVFEKIHQQWRLVDSPGLSAVAEQTAALAKAAVAEETAFKIYHETAASSNTLVRRPISAEHQIDRLTKTVTVEKLDRQLFEKPYSAVLFSSVTQLNSAPFFSARYVQVVSDPAWNRLLYGDYEGWIKAYGNRGTGPEDLRSPHGIDRDSEGKIYVADTGNHRIVVLRLEGNGNDTELKFQLAFGADELMHPYDVAWDDGGTPFDASDDLIWVADTGHGRILGYAISGGAAELRYEYGSVGNGTGSFFEPTVVAVGRFNGVANGVLYVADTGNRRLVQLAVRGSELEWAAAYSGKEESQFTAIDVDHWGNVYAADHSYRELIKFSSGLEPLAVLKSDDASLIDPLNFHVTFGKVYIESENQSYWAGYDQAFVVEKWSESSGGERYQLGIDLTDLAVELSGDLDEVSVRSKLTDHGKVNLAIIDQTSNVPIRQMALGWMIPGDKNVSWDRRDNLGWQVEPGYYRLQLTAESSYGNFAITKETQPFYLPLYYWEDSGANAYRDAHLIQGSRSSAWGNAPHQSIAKHPSEVVYRFSELNPTVDYEIKAEFYNPAGHYLKQSISVDGAVIFDEFEVTADIKSLGWQPLPKEMYADGQIDIRITKTAGAGEAVISQLWLREANFDPAHPPVLQDSPNPVPREFTLLQNYPNPFNPSTTIEFGVPNLSLLPLEEGTSSSPLEGGTPPFNSPLEGGSRGVLVTLRIFNVKGQTVRELVNEALPPGQHSVVWNGRDDFGRPLASGVYFYQLKAGEVQQVKRLILMK